MTPSHSERLSCARVAGPSFPPRPSPLLRPPMQPSPSAILWASPSSAHRVRAGTRHSMRYREGGRQGRPAAPPFHAGPLQHISAGPRLSPRGVPAPSPQHLIPGLQWGRRVPPRLGRARALPRALWRSPRHARRLRGVPTGCGPQWCPPPLPPARLPPRAGCSMPQWVAACSPSLF